MPSVIRLARKGRRVIRRTVRDLSRQATALRSAFGQMFYRERRVRLATTAQQHNPNIADVVYPDTGYPDEIDREYYMDTIGG